VEPGNLKTKEILNSFDKEKEMGQLISNVLDKYNDTVSVNNENPYFYFEIIKKNTNELNNLKEINKKFQSRSKHYKDVFNQTFLNNNKLKKVDNTFMQKSIFYKEVDNSVQILSLLSSDAFKKFYISVFYNQKEVVTDDLIFKIFTLYCFSKELTKLMDIQLMDGENVINNDCSNMPIIQCSIISKPVTKGSYEHFISKSLYKNLTSFYKYLSSKPSNTKSTDNNEIKEESIFTKEIYQINKTLLKQAKIKFIAAQFENLKQLSITDKPYTKQELEYIKDCHSLIFSNGSNSFQIMKK
jgi:hypothetical protein